MGARTLSGELDWNATALAGEISESIPRLRDDVDGDL